MNAKRRSEQKYRCSIQDTGRIDSSWSRNRRKGSVRRAFWWMRNSARSNSISPWRPKQLVHLTDRFTSVSRLNGIRWYSDVLCTGGASLTLCHTEWQVRILVLLQLSLDMKDVKVAMLTKKRLRGGQTLADSTLVVAVETLKVGKCLVSTFTFTPHTSITAWLNKGLKNQWRSSKQQKTTNQLILRSKCHVVAQVSVTTP